MSLCRQILRIEEELKVRYDAEEIWTGLKTDPEKLEVLLTRESWSKAQLTSNPNRVQWLLTKLKELKIQVQGLEKNAAFRPTVSQVDHWDIFIMNYYSSFLLLRPNLYVGLNSEI